MNNTKFKYYQKVFQLGLIQIALLFSVFTFTGYNNQIESSVCSTFNIELVQSNSDYSAYILSKKDFITTKTLRVNTTDKKTTFDQRYIEHFNKLLTINLKSCNEKLLQHLTKSVKALFKIPKPSLEDESLRFLIS